jgi:hypothetical protein
MLRLESDTGWWLITHPDHAHLAGHFAQHWGNAHFRRPTPREVVLLAIHAHDDGWAIRDAAPSITREGKPSAFSAELVGKYSAFEEIDLVDYLAVRNQAVMLMAEREPYAAVLISMHTCNLLTERSDRSTIRPEHLPLLDHFLADQNTMQKYLLDAVRKDNRFSHDLTTDHAIRENFRLLQACDNLSLLACVDYKKPSSLLHTLAQNDGGHSSVKVTAAAPDAERSFHLHPYPFDERPLTVSIPARHVYGKTFSSDAELQQKFALAHTESLTVTLSK